MEASSFKNPASVKHEAASSHFEVDANDLYLRKQARTVAMIDAVRIGITTLALLSGVATLGLSGNALSVYNSTHLSEASWLSLWPAKFDLRPTVALVVGSSIVTIANIAGLLCSKVPHIRNNTPLHTPMMFAAPFLGFAAALIAIIFFYAINASTTVDSLLSWTCRWTSVSMSSAPYFGTLCHASWASVVLAVVLVPLEALALCAAGWQLKTERHTMNYASARKGSQSPGA
ncbi:hypothetical protein M406DRAFT_354244 [Cryphonectria parasitica EP155]|uniref:Uncharacterized protein n=1 Tax=Cryphonectria parasitica (strain ATCC 38755 / EP155) TaxID=660469 RepID=A0A9P5CUI1_CRYP1|nr:uncharacterized protein M406DRAFT_354244 [Cryphonectria parasitica EP155]KAF3770075.1 hypothetical protein M406DRAFT_354244 [Cryphonectria parasitica EP155]